MCIKWIKLDVNLFDNRKIKAIRRMPKGNDYVLIWIMLLSIAGKTNDNGRCYFSEGIYYTPEMLSEELDYSADIISEAIEIFDKFNMITLEDEGFSITGWEEHQNVQGMARIREQNRERVRRFREKHAADEPKQTKAEPEPEQKAKKFIAPTVEEVQSYLVEKGLSIDAQYFVDYYARQGWTLKNGRPIKDWKACVRTWKSNETKNQPTTEDYDKGLEEQYG